MTAGTTMLMFQAIGLGRAPQPLDDHRRRVRVRAPARDIEDRDARYARDRRPADIRGLDPEEDGWLIDQIIRQRPRRRQEAAFAAWAQSLIDDTEARP
jgi:hypothetical protein